MPTGLATAYDLTVGVVVNMDEAIYMLSPQDTPLLTGVGADGLTLLPMDPVDEIVFDWMHDTILTPRSLLVGAITTGDVTVNVTTGDGTKFSTGDIITIGKAAATESLRVTGIATDALTVTRAWGGTATNYTSGDIVAGLGTALAEGSVPEAARTNDRSQVSNVTQIFGPTKVDMSRTEQQVRKYGVGSEWNHQLMKRLSEHAISREQAYLYGIKVNSTSAKIRTTGGLRSFVLTNVMTSAALDETSLGLAEQGAYNRGGFADVVMGNPAVFTGLTNATDTNRVRQTVDDPRRGRIRVEFVDTEFGSVCLARNRWCLRNDAFGFNREQVRRRVLQPVVFERMGKIGDSDQGFIVSEEGLEVKGESHLFRFNSLTNTTSI